ncbi:MAG: hypothetical protein JSU96_04780 [Acidobacteriota bacterium]|nr:MAG: hypothetical protein JSU96_04780 [Acidobacteriota bacterium]
MHMLKVKVLSYDGYKADERPRVFELGSIGYEVRKVLDRWYEPGGAYFKVRASDGNIYILKNSFEKGWSLVAFRQERTN